MPKRIPEEKLSAILEIVAQFPNGGSVDQVATKLPPSLPRRTLQYRIAQLVQSKRLIPKGEGRGRRYQVPVQIMEDDVSTGAKNYIKISPEAVRIRSYVNGAISTRRPVGYNRAFLEDYQPNVSFYLSAEIRQGLAKNGEVPGHNIQAGTYIKQIYNRLLIDLSWNSSRLEGNTYSLLDTVRLLEQGQNAEGKDAEETQMILNHKAAIELLVDQAVGIGFNSYTICNLHALLSDNLLADPAACGRLRLKPVGIEGTVFHPLEVPQIIEEYFQLILSKSEAINDPFEQAFFVMVHLPYLQPFEDVNKRVSRLAANIPFIRRNICPLSFVDVPKHDYVNAILGVYELNRIEYLRDVFVWAYGRSCARYSAVRQSLGEPDLFRMKYRSLIANVVTEVVRTDKDKKEADFLVNNRAIEWVPPDDRAHFVEVVETELINLHEGNIARYQLRPMEFNTWQKNWC